MVIVIYCVYLFVLRMREKIKIRFNHLFNYVEGDKRKQFKKYSCPCLFT